MKKIKVEVKTKIKTRVESEIKHPSVSPIDWGEKPSLPSSFRLPTSFGRHPRVAEAPAEAQGLPLAPKLQRRSTEGDAVIQLLNSQSLRHKSLFAPLCAHSVLPAGYLWHRGIRGSKEIHTQFPYPDRPMSLFR
jgi:hypothetical protein